MLYEVITTLGLAAKLKEQEQDSIDVSPVTDMADFEVKSYSKWNIFNFHSWAPAFVNVDSKIVKPGVSAVSQNLLGTAVTTMGFNADPHRITSYNVCYTKLLRYWE